MSYEQRNIYILKLPLQQDDIVLRPELTVINFYHRMSVDIGAICYLIREPVTKIIIGQLKRKSYDFV